MTAAPVLIGLPYDASSSHLRGAAEAPPAIRRALASAAGNAYSEFLTEVAPGRSYHDQGDLDFSAVSDVRARITEAIHAIASTERPFVALGGDHSVTYPILKGLTPGPEGLTILQIDAHPDLYDEFEGDRYSHACPFARILEEGLASHLVQVGLRAETPDQRDQAVRFRVEQITMRAFADGARPGIAGDVYVSIDLDGLDPGCAPGVSHREPGGLSVRDVLGMLHFLDARIVGADVVEYNPSQDIGGVTAGVAAKLVKELLAKVQRTS